MRRIYPSLLFLICLLVSGCKTKKVDISNNELSVDIQATFFRGAQPDINYSSLVLILGEPMEYLDLPGDYYEREHSPIYYLNDGKIICHWSGDEDELVGMVEYAPYNSSSLHLDMLLSKGLMDYGIKPSTTLVRVYQNDVLLYRLVVDNYQIKRIEYWMAKRKFMNVAY